MADQLTHVDGEGAARIVDIGDKSTTRRTAQAEAICRMRVETAKAIKENTIKKGDVLQVARLAAIGAAKRTDELIPLCHTLLLDKVDADFEWLDDVRLRIITTAACSGKTGVEMEALVAASTAALTVYDMCKAIDREMVVESVGLLAKTGGARGDFNRAEISHVDASPEATNAPAAQSTQEEGDQE